MHKSQDACECHWFVVLLLCRLSVADLRQVSRSSEIAQGTRPSFRGLFVCRCAVVLPSCHTSFVFCIPPFCGIGRFEIPHGPKCSVEGTLGGDTRLSSEARCAPKCRLEGTCGRDSLFHVLVLSPSFAVQADAPKQSSFFSCRGWIARREERCTGDSELLCCHHYNYARSECYRLNLRYSTSEVFLFCF